MSIVIIPIEGGSLGSRMYQGLVSPCGGPGLNMLRGLGLGSLERDLFSLLPGASLIKT